MTNLVSRVKKLEQMIGNPEDGQFSAIQICVIRPGDKAMVAEKWYRNGRWEPTTEILPGGLIG